MDYAIQMMVLVVLGIVGGNWLDQHWHTMPILTLLGLVAGMVSGIIIMYKRNVISQEQHRTERNEEDPLP